MEMQEVNDAVGNIYNTLEANRNIPTSDVMIASINENVQNICMSYDNTCSSLIRDMKVLRSKHINEMDDTIRQYEIKFEREKDIRDKLQRIWNGKKLVRQIANDRFHKFAVKYKPQLDLIQNCVLETKLTNKNIKIKRPNILTEHIGAKLAYAIICDEISIPYISHNLCFWYIKDNDEMHPEYKPLSKVMDDLKIYENTARSLTIDIQKKYDIDPEIISEEIKFFIDTEK